MKEQELEELVLEKLGLDALQGSREVDHSIGWHLKALTLDQN